MTCSSYLTIVNLIHWKTHAPAAATKLTMQHETATVVVLSESNTQTPRMHQCAVRKHVQHSHLVTGEVSSIASLRMPLDVSLLLSRIFFLSLAVGNTYVNMKDNDGCMQRVFVETMTPRLITRKNMRRANVSM